MFKERTQPFLTKVFQICRWNLKKGLFLFKKNNNLIIRSCLYIVTVFVVSTVWCFHTHTVFQCAARLSTAVQLLRKVRVTFQRELETQMVSQRIVSSTISGQETDCRFHVTKTLLFYFGLYSGIRMTLSSPTGSVSVEIIILSSSVSLWFLFGSRF